MKRANAVRMTVQAVVCAGLALTLVVPSQAQFRLRVEDVGAGIGTVITDEGAGDSATGIPGLITFIGGVGGNFTINITTGTSKPVVSNVLDLTSVNIATTGAGTLRLTLEDTGYTFGADGPTFVSGSIGGVLTAPAGSSITAQGWVNPGNLVPTLGADQAVGAIGAIPDLPPAGSAAAFSPVASTGPGAFFFNDSAAFTKAGPYSLFSSVTLTLTGPGSVSLDLQVAAVPEPGSVSLVLGGLVAGGMVLRRRALRSRK